MSCHWHFKLPPCDELGLVACLMCILSLPFDSDSNIRSSETLSMDWNISGGDISTDDLDPLPTVVFLWARKLIIFSRSWTLPIRESSEDGYVIVEMIYRSSMLQQYYSGRKFTLFSLNQGHMFGHWLCRGSSNMSPISWGFADDPWRLVQRLTAKNQGIRVVTRYSENQLWCASNGKWWMSWEKGNMTGDGCLVEIEAVFQHRCGTIRSGTRPPPRRILQSSGPFTTVFNI